MHGRENVGVIRPSSLRAVTLGELSASATGEALCRRCWPPVMARDAQLLHFCIAAWFVSNPDGRPRRAGPRALLSFHGASPEKKSRAFRKLSRTFKRS